ncbi:MAG: tol-pal system YbgF family protein [Terriglobia bacterium]
MARLHRQDLKKDEFIDTLDGFLLWVEDHGRSLLALAVIAVFGGGTVGGFYWYFRRQEQKATTALAAALLTYEAPVQKGLPPLPGQGVQRTFTSEEEKYQAAEKEFAAVREQFPRTRAGLMARHYQALCQFQLGRSEAAVTALEEIARAGDRNVAALARLHLAGFYESLGRREEAEKLYRQLAEQPTATVPRELALLSLANLQAGSNPAEARQLYNQVKSEFPDSAVASEIDQRLERLPAPSSAPSQP